MKSITESIKNHFTNQKQLLNFFSNRTLFLFFLIFILFLFFSIFVDLFLSSYNILNMSKYAVEIGLIALAETLIMISGGGGIDLSVGSMLSLLSIIVGLSGIELGLGIGSTILLTLSAGFLCGAFNGILITVFHLPPLIATLGNMYIFKSLALVITGGMPFSGFSNQLGIIGQSTIFGIPFQLIVILIPVYIIIHIMLNKTIFGRYLYGTGINELAAKFSLVPFRKVRFWSYTIGGILVALAALVLTSRVGTAKPDAGLGYELQAITIAVLGGASVRGGKGTAIGTLLATVVVIMVYNALDLSGIHPIWQLGTLGLLLLGSSVFNKLLNKSS